MNSKPPVRIWNGRTLHSATTTELSQNLKVARQVESWGTAFAQALVFVPSPLEGWGLDELFSLLPQSSCVVLFEKEPGLAVSYSPDLERAFWLESDTEEAIRQLFRRLPLASLRRCLWLTLNGGWLLHGSRYRAVFKRLEGGLTTYWSNRLTSLHLGPLWVRNLFDNLAEPEFNPTHWPQWGSDPVVVCGAGTSLEAWLPLLKQHRQSVRVLAADTALPVLCAGGIEPDGVVCLEAQQVNLCDFLPAAGRPVALFTDLSSHPATRRALTGEVFWFATKFADLHLWEHWQLAQVPIFDPMGSVGVAAVAVALRLTTGPLFLTGLDFSWPQGRSHAKGAPAHTSRLFATTRVASVEQPRTWPSSFNQAVGGKAKFRTTGILRGYAAALADLVRPVAHRVSLLGSDGLELGIERRHQWPVSLTSQPTKAPILNPQPSGSSSFLAWREHDKLSQLLESLEALNRGEAVWTDLQKQLLELDYLYFSFADPDLRLESGYLSRIKVVATWLHSRLKQRLT